MRRFKKKQKQLMRLFTLSVIVFINRRQSVSEGNCRTCRTKYLTTLICPLRNAAIKQDTFRKSLESGFAKRVINN